MRTGTPAGGRQLRGRANAPAAALCSRPRIRRLTSSPDILPARRITAVGNQTPKGTDRGLSLSIRTGADMHGPLPRVPPAGPRLSTRRRPTHAPIRHRRRPPLPTLVTQGFAFGQARVKTTLVPQRVRRLPTGRRSILAGPQHWTDCEHGGISASPTGTGSGITRWQQFALLAINEGSPRGLNQTHRARCRPVLPDHFAASIPAVFLTRPRAEQPRLHRQPRRRHGWAGSTDS
jgi:hypothetical protein